MKNYDLIEKINNRLKGIWFDHIEGYGLVGDPRSNSYEHPIQYIAYTNVREGDDDPFEGVGWTPSEALRNLYNSLSKE